MTPKVARAKDENPGKLLTIEQVQGALDISRSKVYQLGQEGQLEIVKLDRLTRVTERSLNRFLEELAKLLTIKQTQDALNCSRSKVMQLAREGRLELVKFGSTRVTDRSLQKLLRQIAADSRLQQLPPKGRRINVS